MADEPQVGFVTMGQAASRGRGAVDRHRHARLRVHGQGPHERAQEDRVHASGRRRTIPRLVAISGRNEEAVARGRAALRVREVVDRLAGRRRRPGRPGLRQRRPERHRTSSRRSRRRRRASTSSARSRSGRTADESYEIWKGVAETGVKHQCRVQLPLLPGDPAREADDRRRRARRDLPLPRALPPGVDHGPAVPEGLAARQGGGGLGRARRPRRARDRPVALPRRRARRR